MKPAPFDFIAAESLDEALAALAELGDDARPIAGGQSLGPMLNLRLAQPEALIDITRIPDFGGIVWSEDAVAVGADVTQAALLGDQANGPLGQLISLHGVKNGRHGPALLIT